jgi:hypothetical protein
MKKLAHILLLAVFSIACFFLWAILTVAPKASHGAPLPAFTLLCVSLKPLMIILPGLAAAYCLWLLFRKAERVPNWVSFFAVTMSVLVLVALPTLIAAYLPLANTVFNLASK